ncbi:MULTISPECIES: heme NO-binding domain-containing protein [unclassified Neptuniibacter]|jgi:hypothetical protein|uniref:heme NO-binding domain-containing protein n=1 Tax=unclassified Neptuniibacter TaxID=2630693 RepID=UPI0026E129F1|nr:MULTISPECIES: heme NO-binding domain-containing protein [unclassified Neptuniibacter]MDO6512673.1 heme NO-binding domain-containing protein [Neptuniibacter sp. 2_MG-2023]MDO6593479.1 heme NO-binding domain-containing protein [Neptuniibacter sp. 1_MG-2023]
MKGVIFNVLEEMVVEQYSMQVWNEILESQSVDGIYTAGESYPDEELFNLVSSISDKTGMMPNTLIEAFGIRLFKGLATRYPLFIEAEDTLKGFLKSIDSVIHTEVRKLYDNPNLPDFEYAENTDDTLLMRYRSPRKLCILAEGLIRGAATHYDTAITIDHPVCMHKGSDHCDLILRFI